MVFIEAFIAITIAALTDNKLCKKGNVDVKLPTMKKTVSRKVIFTASEPTAYFGWDYKLCVIYKLC